MGQLIQMNSNVRQASKSIFKRSIVFIIFNCILFPDLKLHVAKHLDSGLGLLFRSFVSSSFPNMNIDTKNSMVKRMVCC